MQHLENYIMATQQSEKTTSSDAIPYGSDVCKVTLVFRQKANPDVKSDIASMLLLTLRSGIDETYKSKSSR